ncbi:MAG: c-type cytochrome [Chloroflexi bacterium]|nr:c-type cytochrome [Chloroflexota bacterium]
MLRRVALGFGLGLALALLLLVLVATPVALTHRDAGGLETAYGRTVVSLAERFNESSTAGALSRANQVPPADPRAVTNAGRNAYAGLCASCHGALGDGKGTLGQATFPPATDLTSPESKARSDSELQAIIRDGLGFTAMPGFGGELDGETLGALLNYLRALQDGQAQPVMVPTPTADQFAAGEAHGDAAARGAALYFANGCQNCHGPGGQAPDELALTDISTLPKVVRGGQPGMPAFDSSRLSDAQIDDIVAYLNSLPPPEDE